MCPILRNQFWSITLFVTMSQINKFHSHKFSYNNSYHKEILNLLKPPSHNPNKCKQNHSEINIWYSMTSLYDISMMSWVIWCWYENDLNTHSHRKLPFDFQQPIGIKVPTQGIHDHSCDLLLSNRNVRWLMNPVMWFQIAN